MGLLGGDLGSHFFVGGKLAVELWIDVLVWVEVGSIWARWMQPSFTEILVERIW